MKIQYNVLTHQVRKAVTPGKDEIDAWLWLVIVRTEAWPPGRMKSTILFTLPTCTSVALNWFGASSTFFFFLALVPAPRQGKRSFEMQDGPLLLEPVAVFWIWVAAVGESDSS